MTPSLHVLVVEPEPELREQVSDLLVEAGLEVTNAFDDDDARRVLSVFRVDVVVGALASAPAPVIALDTPVHALVLLEAIRDAASRTGR